MSDTTNINFNINIHFENGMSIEKEVPLRRAVHLAMRDNVIIDPNSDLYEINRADGDTIIIPMTMIFIVHKSPEFKGADHVNRRGLYERDGGRCGYCGKHLTMEQSTIDHVLPRSKQGPNTWDNVVLACVKCNRKKDNKTPEQAGMPLRKGVKLVKPSKKVMKFKK